MRSEPVEQTSFLLKGLRISSGQLTDSSASSESEDADSSLMVSSYSIVLGFDT